MIRTPDKKSLKKGKVYLAYSLEDAVRLSGKGERQSRKLSALHPWSAMSTAQPLSAFPSQLNRRVPSTFGIALHSSVRLFCKHPGDTPSSVFQCCIAFFFIVVTTNPTRSSYRRKCLFLSRFQQDTVHCGWEGAAGGAGVRLLIQNLIQYRYYYSHRMRKQRVNRKSGQAKTLLLTHFL